MGKDPEKDPYDVLGVTFEASDSEISKAYRKLALQLHPDKQQGKTAAEQDEISKKFHDVKEARSFLLDVEHAEDRRKYDAKRQSIRLRQQAEAIREKSMSERRKRMRDELKQKEHAATGTGSDKESPNDSQAKYNKRRRHTGDDDDKALNELRKEGKRKREQYTVEMDAKQMEEELRMESQRAAERSAKRKQQKHQLEERQVRLKWDRKRILKQHNKIFKGQSPSEDSLAQLMSQFGTVEHVELLSKKGNQALVTFADPTSCKPCVNAYATSKDIRAKFAGQRKEQEGDGKDDDEEEDGGGGVSTTGMKNSRHHAGETLEERKRRQAVEREELLRQMEQDEEREDQNQEISTNQSADTTKPRSRKPHETTRSKPIITIKSLFPLPFPESDEKYKDLSPIQSLELFEDKILKEILSPKDYASMRCKTYSNS
jgi:DnaJ homolog subfamily C member 17